MTLEMKCATALALILTAPALAATPALAQEAKPAQAAAPAPADDQRGKLEEVVVTAQRREENIQRIPIVVHAVDAQLAAQRGVDTVMDLGNVAPGLRYNRNTSTGLVFLRGVGASTGAAGQEGPISFYMDDVYLYSLNANMFELNNIQRIEVLAGPQGTLFGRNALGGIIQVVTKDPKHTPSYDAHVGYGNYAAFHTDFYGTTGITDTLAVDFSLLYKNQDDGFGRNIANNAPVYRSDEISVRTKLLWTPDDKTDVTVTLMHDQRHDDTGVSSRILPGSLGLDRVTTAPADFYDVNLDTSGVVYNREWLTTLKATRDLGWGTFKNITSYQKNTNIVRYDTDFTPAFISLQYPNRIDSETWTEELQLVSPKESSISWIAGLFYLHNASAFDPLRVWSNPPSPVNGRYFDDNANLDTNSYAAFAQATATVAPRTRLTAGLRYTEDQKHVYGASYAETGVVFARGDQKASWSKVTYRLSVDYSLTDNTLLYASYNRGFKAGTFNPTAPADPAVDPEVIDDYEGGIKSEIFDRRLRLNVGGFYYNYSGLQLRQVTAQNIIRLLNAADSRNYGVDASLEAVVTDNLTIQAGLELLDAKFKDFPNAPATARNPAGGNSTVLTNFAGRNVFQAPKMTANLGAQYLIETGQGDVSLSANYQYNDGFSWTAEVDDRAHEKSFGLLDVGVSWTAPSKRWDVKLWGKNITGTKYNAYVNTSAFGDYGSPGAPATFGITVGAHM